jgi:3-oxoacyl-[acyl-carrier-protein] synthase II
MTADIVVTGLGAVTSVGTGADEVVEALLAGASGVRQSSEEGAPATAPCADFDAEAWMTPKEARRTDRFAQLALAAALQAAKEAKVPEDVDPERLGILMGTGVGGLVTLQRECEAWIANGDRAVSPLFVPMMMPNAATGAVAMALGAHGPGWSVASACATGAHAIGEAMRMIQRGEADVVLAGGAEAALTGLCIAAFKRMGALSRRGVSSPFDVERDGFIMGEGAGAVVLEAAEYAQARGATILGEIAGVGISSDGYHIAAPDPEGRGVVRALQVALSNAGLAPSDITHINAHATSTPAGDVAEAKAIREVFGAAADGVVVTAPKSTFGHLLGAAGAVEAIATLLSINEHIVPPTLNLDDKDDDVDLDVVRVDPRPLRPGPALSNAFGFGGHNVVLVIKPA